MEYSFWIVLDGNYRFCENNESFKVPKPPMEVF